MLLFFDVFGSFKSPRISIFILYKIRQPTILCRSSLVVSLLRSKDWRRGYRTRCVALFPLMNKTATVRIMGKDDMMKVVCESNHFAKEWVGIMCFGGFNHFQNAQCDNVPTNNCQVVFRKPNKLHPLKKTCIVFQGYQWLDWVPLGEAREISCWICGSVWGWWFSNVLCVVFEHLILISLQKGCNLRFLFRLKPLPGFQVLCPQSGWTSEWCFLKQPFGWVSQCTGQRVHPRKQNQPNKSPKNILHFWNAYTRNWKRNSSGEHGPKKAVFEMAGSNLCRTAKSSLLRDLSGIWIIKKLMYMIWFQEFGL